MMNEDMITQEEQQPQIANVDTTYTNLDQQLEQLTTKIERCVSIIEELRIEKQLLQEQVDALNERNQRIMNTMQELIKKMDDTLCQTEANS